MYGSVKDEENTGLQRVNNHVNFAQEEVPLPAGLSIIRAEVGKQLR